MELDFSYLIEAVAAQAAVDPITRFVDSLAEPLRTHAKETVRLHDELISNMQRLLIAEPSEVAGYAEWIARHAHEAGYRWASLRSSAIRWSTLQTDALVFRTSQPSSKDQEKP